MGYACIGVRSVEGYEEYPAEVLSTKGKVNHVM